MQKKVWEEEYRRKVFMFGEKPQKSFLRFLRFIKKEKKKENPDFTWSDMQVLDLGSGEGKNSLHLAQMGAEVVGLDLSERAVRRAEEKLQKLKATLGNLKASFKQGSFGANFSFPEQNFDIVLDITSSNSLGEKERAIYLFETKRVLKERGYFFLRALCKDGDKNAKKLLRESQGMEKDSYVLPEVGLVERVFSEKDLREMYGQDFHILEMKKESHYSNFSGRSFKRNFWIVYLQKR